MTIDLSGLVVLVTGGSRGIGRGIARGMLEAGARVGVHYVRSKAKAEELTQDFPERAVALQADLADLDETEQLFDDALEAFGQIDVLVNNAGVWLQAPLRQSHRGWADGWQKTMAVNLRAPEQLARRVIRHLQERATGGRIINVASRAAFRGDDPEYMTYAASKAGLVALTRSIARGFGGDNITAFTLAPGFVYTGMTAEHLDKHGEQARAAIALNKLTEPDDIAPTAVFLASGQADHATGSTIDLNAGSYVH